MNLELHIIQNFAPANLNRDDTGSPKSCEFGGYRRARISSQAIKRAIRKEFRDQELIPQANQAVRSKRIVDKLAEQLAEGGRDLEQAKGVAEAGLALLNIKLAREGKTQYLLYLAPAELQAIAAFCEARWDALAAAAAGEKRGKKDAKDAETKQLADELNEALDGGRAADLALFGRMLADLPERNVNAASQVAHAISTHQVGIEFDYYTAVDDLKPEDTAGADMIGHVEFNSACYYRYANIDLSELRKNLKGDGELAEAAVRAFLIASRDAIPTGKQNSFAARNAPSFVFAVVRDRGAWSLANAFVQPVRGTDPEGLIGGSIAALDRHWRDLCAMYGEPEGATLSVCAVGEAPLNALLPARVDTFGELVEKTLNAVRPALVS
ncbi:MAG: type I-E CRISPR-associated protein Cas7/Cse4/CasC [Hyphomicrobiales bacterium]